jgi:hypothetical protein
MGEGSERLADLGSSHGISTEKRDGFGPPRIFRVTPTCCRSKARTWIVTKRRHLPKPLGKHRALPPRIVAFAPRAIWKAANGAHCLFTAD